MLNCGKMWTVYWLKMIQGTIHLYDSVSSNLDKSNWNYSREIKNNRLIAYLDPWQLGIMSLLLISWNFPTPLKLENKDAPFPACNDFWKDELGNPSVKMSSGWLPVLSYGVHIKLLSNFSLTKWWSTSMCFVWSCCTKLLQYWSRTCYHSSLMGRNHLTWRSSRIILSLNNLQISKSYYSKFYLGTWSSYDFLFLALRSH